VTVITRLDLDHQQVLGTTLAAIATEKAAIIRSGVAFAAAQAPEATDVLVRRAAAVGVPLLSRSVTPASRSRAAISTAR